MPVISMISHRSAAALGPPGIAVADPSGLNQAISDEPKTTLTRSYIDGVS